MNAKQRLLETAGAQVTPRSATTAGSVEQRCSACWPLTAASWSGLGLDLSKISGSGSVSEAAAALEVALSTAGFRRDLRTIFIIEAVLYYMPLDRAEVLLKGLAALSKPQGTLIATCVDTELLEASRNMEAGHIFANLWYFDCNELLASRGYRSSWSTTKAPRTTRDIAREDYGKDTYVAMYGGAECAFIAHTS